MTSRLILILLGGVMMLVACDGGDDDSNSTSSNDDNSSTHNPPEVQFNNGTHHSDDPLILTYADRQDDSGLPCTENLSAERRTVFDEYVDPGGIAFVQEDSLDFFCEVQVVALTEANKKVCANIGNIDVPHDGSTNPVTLKRGEFSENNCLDTPYHSL